MSEPADTEAWRQRRLESLVAPDGYLAVAGLFFPAPGRSRVGSDPVCELRLPEGSAPALAGHVLAEQGRLWLELSGGVQGTLDDEPIRGRVELRPADATSGRAPGVVRIARVTLHAHRSGARLGIRLWDPDSPIRTRFSGLRWYPIGERWRVEGRFVPYAHTRIIPLENVLGDLVNEPCSGEVEVELAGETLRLVGVDRGRRLWFIFRDATSDTETYGIRFLYADQPDARGVVVLDFNRAYNPPCAFNPHTTCPLPPAGNRLTVAIEAGEKLYQGPLPG